MLGPDRFKKILQKFLVFCQFSSQAFPITLTYFTFLTNAWKCPDLTIFELGSAYLEASHPSYNVEVWFEIKNLRNVAMLGIRRK